MGSREYEKTIDKYINFLKKYNLDCTITFDDSLTKFYKTINNMDGCYEITLNSNKIPYGEFETYLSFVIRKILLPNLVFQTDRLTLRRYNDHDSKDCFEFLSDKETCYMDDGSEPFEAMDEEYLQFVRGFKNQETRYMIILKTENKVIGTINLQQVESRVVEALEVGYIINPNYRRQGYAYEALSNILNFLLHECNLDMVIAKVISRNESSLKLLKKLGFTKEGNVHKSFYYPGEGPIDMESFYIER